MTANRYYTVYSIIIIYDGIIDRGSIVLTSWFQFLGGNTVRREEATTTSSSQPSVPQIWVWFLSNHPALIQTNNLFSCTKKGTIKKYSRTYIIIYYTFMVIVVNFSSNVIVLISHIIDIACIVSSLWSLTSYITVVQSSLLLVVFLLCGRIVKLVRKIRHYWMF